MRNPSVGVVILNWNRLDLTQKCLASLDRQAYRNYEIIVIDNGSSDGSVEWLEKQNLKLIRNSKNLGFARAINQGISRAIDDGCKYVVSLNNDAQPDKDWLKKLVGHMDNHPLTGFAQGASMQAEDKKRFDSTGIYLERGFIPNQRASGGLEPRLDIVPIGPNAAGAIYRASMLTEVRIKRGEYFDNRFFAYVEDVDFDLRCSLRGFEFAYVPGAKMYHVGSATGIKVARKKMYWGARNMVWLVFKNTPASVFRRTFKMIARSHLANLQFLWREQRSNFLPYLRGIIAGLLLCSLFIPKRRANLKARKLSDQEFLALLTPSNPPLSNPLRRLANLLK